MNKLYPMPAQQKSMELDHKQNIVTQLTSIDQLNKDEENNNNINKCKKKDINNNNENKENEPSSVSNV